MTHIGLITHDEGDGAGSSSSSSDDGESFSTEWDPVEDQATASGSDLATAMADAISDRKGEPRPDTQADIDPDTDPGRSMIGANAGLFSAEPSDTPTEVSIATNEQGDVTDVQTSNDVPAAGDSGGSGGSEPERGVEQDAGGSGGSGSSTSGGSGGSPSPTEQVVPVPFPVPQGVQSTGPDGESGIPLLWVIAGVAVVGGAFLLTDIGGSDGARRAPARAGGGA